MGLSEEALVIQLSWIEKIGMSKGYKVCYVVMDRIGGAFGLNFALDVAEEAMRDEYGQERRH